GPRPFPGFIAPPPARRGPGSRPRAPDGSRGVARAMKATDPPAAGRTPRARRGDRRRYGGAAVPGERDGGPERRVGRRAGARKGPRRRGWRGPVEGVG